MVTVRCPVCAAKCISNLCLTGEQVVVPWSENRAVRRVVKLLPTEMLQLCSSVSSCMQTCFMMEKHYTNISIQCPLFRMVLCSLL
jgi:hypothetical protein